MDNFKEFKQASDATIEWIKKEYSSIRTGRAMPNILDSISVMSYGSPMLINQLATVSIEDPKTLRVIPWDKEVIKEIDRAIRESNLGLSVGVDADGLRVSFPELTSERRVLLAKAAKEKYEEARIRVRNEREKNLSEIDKKEKSGEISEDDKFRLRTELQKLVDEINQKLEDIFSKKGKEIQE